MNESYCISTNSAWLILTGSIIIDNFQEFLLIVFKMAEDLPYKAEYAKSNRSSCKLCKSNIAKESLRLAKMVQV